MAIGAAKTAPPSRASGDEPARLGGVDAQVARARGDDHGVVDDGGDRVELAAEALRPGHAQLAPRRQLERDEPRGDARVALGRRQEEPLGPRIPRRRAVERGGERDLEPLHRAGGELRALPQIDGAVLALGGDERPAARGLEDDRRRAEPEVALVGHARRVAAGEQTERRAQLDDRLGVVEQVALTGAHVGVRDGRPDVTVARQRNAGPAPDAAAAGLTGRGLAPTSRSCRRRRS